MPHARKEVCTNSEVCLTTTAYKFFVYPTTLVLRYNTLVNCHGNTLQGEWFASAYQLLT